MSKAPKSLNKMKSVLAKRAMHGKSAGPRMITGGADLSKGFGSAPGKSSKKTPMPKARSHGR
jgi:hypothetical protein